jgi:hypothetical protein
MPTYGLLHSVALVRSDVSEECITSIIRVTTIGELGNTLAVTSNQSTLLPVTDNVPPKCWFLQEPHGVTSQKTVFCLMNDFK